eukprot:TRINITY_DN2126_c0_g1_i1.p1 TRINITY_DN2126_c0_g1~~TRINITY_DN2126_c0_g1_i1.p1  ORF type:complete len:217 (+),score=19.55 TRINITY_DN2126_c0_g1_i1:79-729(+)
MVGSFTCQRKVSVWEAGSCAIILTVVGGTLLALGIFSFILYDSAHHAYLSAVPGMCFVVHIQVIEEENCNSRSNSQVCFNGRWNVIFTSLSSPSRSMADIIGYSNTGLALTNANKNQIKQDLKDKMARFAASNSSHECWFDAENPVTPGLCVWDKPQDSNDLPFAVTELVIGCLILIVGLLAFAFCTYIFLRDYTPYLHYHSPPEFIGKDMLDNHL